MITRLISRPRGLVQSARMLHSHRLTTSSRGLSFTQTFDRSDPQHVPNMPVQRVQILNIPTETRIRLSNAMKSMPSPYAHFNIHRTASFEVMSSQLPQSVRDAIRNFHSDNQGPGVLLIQGLPTDPALPMTPMDGRRSTLKSTFISEACLIGLTTLIGEPFSYASEKNGELIHNVCPVKKSETVQSNESSKVNLSLHVENAYFEDRPDYLALYCLRQDHKKQAFTSFVDVRSVLSKLLPEDIAELQKPVFIIPSPPSHHLAMGGERWSSPRPLVDATENPNLICRFPGMKALTPEAQIALERFEKASRQSDVVQQFALQPGSILLLNNHKGAHGRSWFEPRYDGFDRWLQRVYVRA